jgi:hypothetical protein
LASLEIIMVRAAALFPPVKIAVLCWRFMGWFLVGSSLTATTKCVVARMNIW